jgi:exopolysaccharide biosynthesis polyprenyl glycosylphosphotransferase
MNRQRTVTVALLVLDLVAVVLAFNLVGYLRGMNTTSYALVALLAPMVATVLAIYLIDGYKAQTDMLSVDYTSLQTIAMLGAMLAVLMLTFVFIPAGFELQASRAVIALSFAALVPITLAYRRVIYLRLSAERNGRAIVFLGDAASGRAFRAECRLMGTPQRLIFATASSASAPPFPPESEEKPLPFGEVLGRIERGQLAVEAIVLRETARDLPPEVPRRLVELYFAGVPTLTLELFHQTYWRKIPIYRLNQTWLFQEGFRIAREPIFERIKRVADFALALAGLVAAAPLTALAGLAIRLEDGGPVFFRQMRIGKNHVPFPLLKLRTMRAGPASAERYTRPGDPRITRVGRFLRATRIDEFPQLWNVLRGDMSLIGPRAEWDRLVADYEQAIPCYHFRHLVKPGITGWAQVNYPYGASIEDTVRKLEYDLYYIRHFSFLLDAAIVLKTIHVMLFGKGR